MTDLALPSEDPEPPSGSLKVVGMVSSLEASNGTLGCLPAVGDLESADNATHAASVLCASFCRALMSFGRGRWSECPLPVTVWAALTLSYQPNEPPCGSAALPDRDALAGLRRPSWAQNDQSEQEPMLSNPSESALRKM